MPPLPGLFVTTVLKEIRKSPNKLKYKQHLAITSLPKWYKMFSAEGKNECQCRAGLFQYRTHDSW